VPVKKVTNADHVTDPTAMFKLYFNDTILDSVVKYTKMEEERMQKDKPKMK
jgi:hypothetical protein